MFDMGHIEHDLLEMKATTLYKYGKKVELAEEMYHRKLALQKRLEKILARLQSKQIVQGWFKKKRQQELIERIEKKLQKTTSTVNKLIPLIQKYIEEFKAQREACGMMDHSFIDEFYRQN